MRTMTRSSVLEKTKPASQLFLFSNELNANIDSYFSGNVIVEIELDTFDYKHHKEAESVVFFMRLYCESIGKELYKYMTAVLNYKSKGLSLLSLTGKYHYPMAVHGKDGYTRLRNIHIAYLSSNMRLDRFHDYQYFTLQYIKTARRDPIRLSKADSQAILVELKNTKKAILKSMDDLLKSLHKHFQPKF